MTNDENNVKERFMIKNMQVKTINVLTYEYETFKEQCEHTKDMIKGGWIVEKFENFKVEFSKVEDIRIIK